jgi:hypothetical protein
MPVMSKLIPFQSKRQREGVQKAKATRARRRELLSIATSNRGLEHWSNKALYEVYYELAHWISVLPVGHANRQPAFDLKRRIREESRRRGIDEPEDISQQRIMRAIAHMCGDPYKELRVKRKLVLVSKNP